jgi:hypothetical protein
MATPPLVEDVINAYLAVRRRLLRDLGRPDRGSGTGPTWPRRGPAPADVEIWNNPGITAAWTLDNLDSYWRRLVDGAERIPSIWAAAMLTPYGAVWVALPLRRAAQAQSLYGTPWGRRRDVLAFGDMVITDAHRRYGRRR